MSNIAEGHGRGTTAQLIHFLSISRGSVFEVESQLVLSSDQALGDPVKIANCERLCGEVGRMLYATLNTLRSKQANSQNSNTNL